MWKSAKYYVLWACVCSLTYSACKPHAPNMLSAVACVAVPYFSTLSHKRHDFRKKVIEPNDCVVIFSTKFFSKIFLILRKINLDIIINVHWFLCKVHLVLSDFNKTLIFYRFSKNNQISNFVEILPLKAGLFYEDGRRDAQNDEQVWGS